MNGFSEDPARAALSLALPVLRDLLQSDVESIARFLDDWPLLSELSAADRAWLSPTLAAIRAIEAVIGRPQTEPHEKVEWLDEMIDAGLPAETLTSNDEKDNFQ